MNARRARQLRATAVIAAAAAAVPAASPALAAGPAARPASGSASSSVTLLQLQSAGVTLKALIASLTASTATNPHVASVGLIPLSSSATGSVGAVSVTPASGPKSVGGQSASLPSGLASLTAPSVDVSAVLGSVPTAKALANGLGSLTVLGQPLDVANAKLSAISSAGPSSSTSSKTLTVGTLALPTALKLLQGLGLDLNALTPAQLQSIVQAVLQRVPGAVTTAAAAVTTAGGVASSTVDSAKAAVATAQAAVASAQTGVSNAQGTVNTATTAANTATANLTAALGTVNSGLGTINTALAAALQPAITTQTASTWSTVTTAQKTIIDTVLSGAATALTNAINANTAAQLALAVANTALTTAQATLQTAQDALTAAQALLAALVGLVNAVAAALDANSLAKLGNLTVQTIASAGATPVADAKVAVASVNVLGAVTSNIAAGLGALDAAMIRLHGALSGITGNLGAPIDFVGPKVQLLSTHTATDKGSATRPVSAEADVQGVAITLPTITLPTSLALPSALAAAGTAAGNGLALVNGVLKNASGQVVIGQLQDVASHTAAVAAAAPGRGATKGRTPAGLHRGRLPRTGADATLGALGLLALAGAAVLRRRVAGSRS